MPSDGDGQDGVWFSRNGRVWSASSTGPELDGDDLSSKVGIYDALNDKGLQFSAPYNRQLIGGMAMDERYTQMMRFSADGAKLLLQYARYPGDAVYFE